MTPRRALDALYDGAGVVAAVFLVGTLVFVLIGIAGRLLHFHVPGTDAYAGYCMAAAGFLALAHTLKRGEHIRVTLIVERLASARRLWVDRAALAVATLLAGLFAYFSLRLAFQSWQFNDISTATDATPLWLPQLAMAFGTLILFIAVADALVADLRGHRRRGETEAALPNE